MAAPRDILLTSYYITWSKSGDVSIPVTYSNLRRTHIIMAKGLLKRTIEIEYLHEIPIKGISFPLLVSIKNPPYEEVTF